MATGRPGRRGAHGAVSLAGGGGRQASCTQHMSGPHQVDRGPRAQPRHPGETPHRAQKQGQAPSPRALRSWDTQRPVLPNAGKDTPRPGPEGVWRVLSEEVSFLVKVLLHLSPSWAPDPPQPWSLSSSPNVLPGHGLFFSRKCFPSYPNTLLPSCPCSLSLV